jgi:hypothetical protein
MALAPAVAGALRPSQVITWTREDGSAEDLTGATITGTLKPRGGTTRAIAGTLTVTTAASGIFTWAYDAADVVAGLYEVQFNAAFAASPTPARTYITSWLVKDQQIT